MSWPTCYRPDCELNASIHAEIYDGEGWIDAYYCSSCGVPDWFDRVEVEEL